VKQLNIGVIGLGEIGTLHCEALMQLPQARLLAVADIDETRAKQVAGQTGAQAYQNYKELLARADIDAVIIATPDHLHKGPCVHAAQAGKHILVEKPLAMTVEDSKTILEAAEKAQVKLMVGFTLRFFPQYQHARASIEKGELGTPISLFARRTNLITQSQRLKGRAGVLFFLGIHDFDILRWMVGAEAKEIFCVSAKHDRSQYNVEDETFTTIRFENGVIACAHIGWCLPEGHPTGFDFKLDIAGTKGLLNLDMVRQGVEKHVGGHSSFPPMASPLIAEDRSFIEAVLYDKDVPVTGEDGFKAVEMTLAALESIKTGRPVNL
jgi:UDP-N-acetylglucosamine 3-dehydrogenase